MSMAKHLKIWNNTVLELGLVQHIILLISSYLYTFCFLLLVVHLRPGG